ncbi:hypothetical protein D0T51_07910 [Parabacteroides sp. 52]|uniref:hypothetical protein n=1 Tax=unclassified Parabacteroides TaxID=2649774 RepID=UPI0013D1A8C7|nr:MULTISPECIES: hypothetical protein [unclassified Parabacteroides]MDH6534973.1 hypothetical protein [Parabacteroides sp. PM5-20]NDV55649.1 hypothetical protein [Parabacteroides sp. 52]
MKKKENNLEQLKGKNPFTVPEGYLEELTSQIMSQLPEKPHQRERTVTMMDKVRPWLYMAAAFIGLLFFFKTLIGIPGEEEGKKEALLVHTQIPSETKNAIYAEEEYYEDDEYLEYIENQYANYLLAEEMAFSE